MSNVTIDGQLSVDNLPLQKFLLPAFVLWIITGVINSLVSLCIVYVMITSKPMKRDTLWMVIQMSVMEAVGGFVNSSYGSFHLYMSLSNLPETRTMFDCWLIVSWDMLASSVIGVIYLELSFDRLFAAVFPLKYNSRPKYYLNVLTVMPWLVTLMIFVSSIPVILSNNVFVPVCILKYALGLAYFHFYSYAMFTFSVAAIFMYAVSVVVLKVIKAKALRNGGNVAEVTARMSDKVTKTMAFIAIAHVLTFTVASSGTEIVTFFEPLRGNTKGPYLYTFYHLGSVSSLPIYYICQSKFRAGFKKLVKKALAMSPSTFASAVVPHT